jgi:DNA-binding XRE family transcriptional regulator
MNTHDWEDLRKKKLTPEQLEKIDDEVAEEVLRIRLSRLAEARRAKGYTQVDFAEILGTSQGNISKIENQDDLLLSTLRRYIDALGGRLELHAVFEDDRVELSIGEAFEKRSHG